MEIVDNMIGLLEDYLTQDAELNQGLQEIGAPAVKPSNEENLLWIADFFCSCVDLEELTDQQKDDLAKAAVNGILQAIDQNLIEYLAGIVSDVGQEQYLIDLIEAGGYTFKGEEEIADFTAQELDSLVQAAESLGYDFTNEEDEDPEDESEEDSDQVDDEDDQGEDSSDEDEGQGS